MPVAENVGGGAELSALRVGSRNQERCFPSTVERRATFNEAVSGFEFTGPSRPVRAFLVELRSCALIHNNQAK